MILQKAQVKIINDTVCDLVTEGQVTSRMLCSGFLAGGIDACQVYKHTYTHRLLKVYARTAHIHTFFFLFLVHSSLTGMGIFNLHFSSYIIGIITEMMRPVINAIFILK